MNLKYTLREIKGNQFFVFIMMVQFIIMFFCLYSLFQVQAFTRNESKKINDYFGNNKIYAIRSATASDGIDSTTKVSEKKIQQAALQLLNSSNFIYTYEATYYIGMPLMDNWDKFARWPNIAKGNGREYYAAYHLVVNKNAIERFNVKLESGRLFNDEEYQLIYGQKIVPVLLGYNYSGHYKVGDIIPSDYASQSYKVIGILKKNQYMPFSMETIDGRYAYLDNYILTTSYIYESYEPMYDGIISEGLMFYDYNKPDSEIMKINNNLKKLFQNTLGINLRIESQQKYIKQELDAAKDQEHALNMVCMTILFFLSITTIIAKLSFIDKRKKEFGVHILSGGSLNNIVFMIYMETFFTIAAAFVVFMTVLLFKYRNINILGTMYIFLTSVFVSMALTIVPIMKVYRLNIANLIKGEE